LAGQSGGVNQQNDQFI